MSGVTAVRQGRRHAEALMIDTCVVRRVSGPPGPLDPDTGERTPPPTETIYSGKCKVQTYEPHEVRPEAGEHVWTVQRYHVHIPAEAAQLAVDDRIEVTASVLDTNLVGRTYRVSGIHHKSFATAQRLLVDEAVA